MTGSPLRELRGFAGLYLGLFVAPPDYQQGDAYRIMFVHVPSAWMSLCVYSILAGAGAVALIWRVKVAEVVAAASAPIGAAFTALGLAFSGAAVSSNAGTRCRRGFP